MSFVTAAIVMGGATLGAGVLAGQGADKAAGATKEAAAMQVAESGRQFDVVNEQFAPYREIGEEFLPQLKDFMRGDYAGFLESPDYKFTLGESEKALERKQSAAGARFGGKALKEAATYAGGLASTHVDKYFNKLFNVVGMGQSAAAGTSQAAMQTGAQNVAAYGQQGANLASIYSQQGQTQANLLTGAAGNLTTLSMYNQMMNKLPAAGV